MVSVSSKAMLIIYLPKDLGNDFRDALVGTLACNDVEFVGVDSDKSVTGLDSDQIHVFALPHREVPYGKDNLAKGFLAGWRARIK
jgi:hypothetical protein